MGGRASQDQTGTQGNLVTERTNNKATRKHKAGRKQKPQAPEPVKADIIKIIIDHFFPDFNGYFADVEDPRRSDRVIYSPEHYIWLGLCMFLFHHGSRSQLENERRSIEFFHNMLTLSGTDEERVATAEAMSYFMEIMNPAGSLELVPGKMTQRLIRSRVLDKYRNSSGEFMIAVDGVHLYTKKGKRPNAVYKEIKGESYSYYCVLEAKLVSHDGIGLSLATVFIENEEEYDKQDCELKAFYRLAEILKQRFPRLPICLLLDGLYPNERVLGICEENQWGYYITLKDGNLPWLREDADIQMMFRPEQAVDYSPEPGVYQHFTWALNLQHKGRRTHFIMCRETVVSEDGIKTTCFVWITDSRPNKHNVAQLAKEARCRWTIEETFNIQKNGGYQLEHSYGTIGFAMKNYYYLLQIAHILHQLMIRSDLFPKLQKKFIIKEYAQYPDDLKLFLAVVAESTLKHFRTIKNFVKRLAESFRTQTFSELAMDTEALGKIQIRLDSS